jgi:ATP-dependent DNA helicase RecQ
VLLFGAADLMTQRRLNDSNDPRHGEALRALEAYAHATACRQQILCAHFTGTDDHPTCGQCDACVDPTLADERVVAAPAPAPVLGAAVRQTILAAVAEATHKVGRINLARALRGSRAKAVLTQGLDRLPQFGALAELDEESIIATIDQLIRDRQLVRRGRKYPTVALPTARAPRERTPRERTPRRRQQTSSITLALDTYRKRMARQLKWKTYMVFQRGVIAAIDQQRPTSKEALARIPGLGPAKIARFGDDILAVVRRQTSGSLR